MSDYTHDNAMRDLELLDELYEQAEDAAACEGGRTAPQYMWERELYDLCHGQAEGLRLRLAAYIEQLETIIVGLINTGPHFTEMGNCNHCDRYAPFNLSLHAKDCPYAAACGLMRHE